MTVTEPPAASGPVPAQPAVPAGGAALITACGTVPARAPSAAGTTVTVEAQLAVPVAGTAALPGRERCRAGQAARQPAGRGG